MELKVVIYGGTISAIYLYWFVKKVEKLGEVQSIIKDKYESLLFVYLL